MAGSSTSVAPAPGPTCTDRAEAAMRITCPHCGPRDSAEFTCFGNTPDARPADNALASDWVAFAYHRDNPKGPVTELWQHVLGCRIWLVVTRDTATHDVTAVRLASERGS